MVLWDEEKRKAFIIDVAVPNIHITWLETIAEKQRKRCELQREIKSMREM